MLLARHSFGKRAAPFCTLKPEIPWNYCSRDVCHESGGAWPPVRSCCLQPLGPEQVPAFQSPTLCNGASPSIYLTKHSLSPVIQAWILQQVWGTEPGILGWRLHTPP